MAKFSKKVGGKEIGDAKTYAKPHTMSGGSVDTKDCISIKTDPNTLAAKDMKPGQPTYRVSAGNPNRDDAKKTGVETRGNGAATKGRIARGPMA
jgi:hypothetical protein